MRLPAHLLRRSAKFAVMAAFTAVTASAFAFGPHETALIVNSESTASVILAETWARLRGIPQCCIVKVAVPRRGDGSFPVAITHGEFVERIWTPATNALAMAGVSRQILAWSFSCDFPARICTSTNSPFGPPATTDISLSGAVFLGGRCTGDFSAIGATDSPLFAGPEPNSDSGRGAQSLDRLRNKLLDDYPIPSSMLSWTGERGLTLSESRAMLKAAAAADSSFPTGTVFFAKNSDVRWNTRAWSVPAAVNAFSGRHGVDAVVSTNSPASWPGSIAGLFAGARNVAAPGSGLLAGSYADHMTSFAAAFDVPAQMKATEWLRRGASFTSGTVTEPYAVWFKFPSAFVFVHALDGCTALESVFLSTKHPLQLQCFGDPLCAPWSPKIEPAIIEESVNGSDKHRLFRARLKSGAEIPRSWRCTWLLDGVVAGNTFEWTLDPDTPAKCLRLVLRDDNRVRHQGWTEIQL